MPTTANVISLKTRPLRSSDHAFNVTGIVDWINFNVASLGASVIAYDAKASLFPHLSDPAQDQHGVATGRLAYDSAKIRQTLLPVAAMSVANEAMAADLDQAIVRRQTQFISRNKQAGALHNLVMAAYPAKVNKLNQLLTLVERHFQAIDSAYNPVGGQPVGVTAPKVVMATRIAGIGTRHDGITHVMEGGGEKQTHNSSSATYLTKFDGTNWVDIKDAGAVALSQETVSVSENDELRHPNLENQIRHQRASVDLLEEILAESSIGLVAADLPQIWANDLAAIDLEIRRLQVQYIETFLVPRVTGRVTTVSVDVGDNIRAGDAAMCVENDDRIQLAGKVKCRAPISVGQVCTIQASNAFSSNPPAPVSLNARVVAIRGYESENEQWSIILEGDNDGLVRLPPNYEFETHPDHAKIIFA